MSYGGLLVHKIVEDEQGFKHAFSDAFDVTVMPHAQSQIWNRVQYQPSRANDEDGGRREALGCLLDDVIVYFYGGRFFFIKERLRLPQIMFLSESGFPMDDVEHIERFDTHVYVKPDGKSYKIVISKQELN